MAALELTTVSDDEVVAFAGTAVHRWGGLAPGTEHHFGGLTARTLDRPPGERLATVATMNDVHFGETACGVVEGTDIGPVLRSEPGEEPYPQLMNEAAVAEEAETAAGTMARTIAITNTSSNTSLINPKS